MPDRLPILPAHIESTVRSIAELHARHDQQTTLLQRTVHRTTAFVGRPSFIGVLTLFVVAWVLGNLAISWSGGEAWDPPPFAWLGGLLSLVALYMTVLILATQRHDDELASHREQLTLELAILSEQKSAKIIELLEELRRDSPHLPSRDDDEARAMAKPADPQSVLDAVRDTHAELLTAAGTARERTQDPSQNPG
jgi:uncharacterized membrane protein